jgi:hypothetical protein
MPATIHVLPATDLHETHCGLLEFGLVDPFGNTIEVGGAHAP